MHPEQRLRATQKYNVRPSADLVKRLQQLAPKVGCTTHNELAVLLMEAGEQFIRTGQLSEKLRELRARISNESPAAADPAFEQLVAESVARALARAGFPQSKPKHSFQGLLQAPGIPGQE